MLSISLVHAVCKDHLLIDIYVQHQQAHFSILLLNKINGICKLHKVFLLIIHLIFLKNKKYHLVNIIKNIRNENINSQHNVLLKVSVLSLRDPVDMGE